MRNCWYCKKEKPENEFYLKRIADGTRCSICKPCTLIYEQEKRQKNKSTYREKDRRYYLKNREKILARQKKQYRKNGYKKAKCHHAVGRALLNGTLIKESCEICSEVKTVAHHDDYNHPLKIRWLCERCHQAWHRDNKAII